MSYVTILESEFDAIFLPERNWVKEYNGHAKEIIYTKRFITKPNVIVKVYSSIHKNDGVSRGCGKDSIKVCAVNTVTDKGLIKTKRIHRTLNWQPRLIARVESVWFKVLEK